MTAIDETIFLSLFNRYVYLTQNKKNIYICTPSLLQELLFLIVVRNQLIIYFMPFAVVFNLESFSLWDMF